MSHDADLRRAPAAAFDRAAAHYDAEFTATPLGRLLREAVWARLARYFRPGMHILELNCGTGEDAVWLARRGLWVTATDGSPAMLAVARAKAERAGVEDRVDFRLLDLARRGDWRPVLSEACPEPDPELAKEWVEGLGNRDWGGRFDGVLSNFGGLNCLADRRPLAASLARVVRPGGRVVLVVMGPLCPWELGWHLAHGQVRTALRRFRSGVEAHVGDGATARVWYPSPRRLRAEFAPWFRPLATVGVGVLLPPSSLGHLVERWPGAFERLARLEQRLAGYFPASVLNDHYLLELESIPRQEGGIAHGRAARNTPSAPTFCHASRIAFPSLRSFWRRLLFWRFRLFQRHRYNRLVLERVGGTPILVLPQVFNPSLFRSGAFLADCLSPEIIPPGATVLDMGTGSGIGAVFAARRAARVVAVDINPEAVRCAQINALLNRVEARVEVRQGDLFAPVRGECFDVVLFNPPYYPGHPRDALDWAWRSDDVRQRFAAELPAALAPGGRALVVLSSDAGVPEWVAAFQTHGLTARVLQQRDLINETVTVFEVRRADDHPL